MKSQLCLLLAGTLFTAANAADWPAIASDVGPDPAVEQRAREILDGMTLEQKVGQLIQAEIKSVTPEDARTYHLGSILNGGGSFPGSNKNSTISDWVDLADAFYDASMQTKAAIPIIWGTDAVHGHNNVIGATLFPHNIGLGATRNPELIRRIGAATAREVAATGIDWIFAPTVAVVRNDRWGRTYEGYSEDPEIVQEYARNMVRGIQGSAGSGQLLNSDHVVATAKHFIGDGGTAGGVDQGDTRVTEEVLRDIHAKGYFSALKAGAQTVMATFNSWNGEKLHGHQYLLNDVLKEKMGFDGFVVSDWNGVGQVPECTNSGCARAINAGVDMIMVPEEWKAYIKNTISQVRQGDISEARIDDAVLRILRVKLRAGLFEAGRPSARPNAGDASIIGCPEHRQIARQAVRESLVLLKNNGDVLPLSRDMNVLVAGPGADNIGQQSGGWSITWQGTGNKNNEFPGATSIYEGIRQVVESSGGTATLEVDGKYKNKPDVAIVVFGETPYAEGQGDRKNVDYNTGSEVRLLRQLQADGVPVVSIFLSGRPMWINPELNASDAFIAAWLPGTEGAGVADVIFKNASGEIHYDFHGQLSYSWPNNPEQTEVNRNDTDYRPLFPYGYGLNYSSTDEVGKLPEEGDSAATIMPGGSSGAMAIFQRRAIAPYKLYVGDSAGWQVPVEGASTTSWGGKVTVKTIDKDVQEDARQLIWHGKGEAQVYLQAASQDLTSYLESESALLVRVRVDSPPKKNVMMRVGCEWPCKAEANLTKVFKTLPGGVWTTLSMDLNCFAQNGADFRKIDTPFLLLTRGKFTLSIADIEIIPGVAREAALSCTK